MGNGWCISLLSPISFSLAFPPCHASLNAITISDDSTLLVGAFADSTLRVWTLTPRQLLSMATGRQLSQIPLSAEDSTTRMMDPLLVCVCVCVHACVCVTAYMSEHLCKFIMNCHMSGPVCSPPRLPFLSHAVQPVKWRCCVVTVVRCSLQPSTMTTPSCFQHLRMEPVRSSSWSQWPHPSLLPGHTLPPPSLVIHSLHPP